MPTTLAVNDIVEARVVCYLADQIGVNVYHYKCSARTIVGADPVTTLTAAVQLTAQFGGEYPDVISQDANFYGVGCRIVSPVPSLEDGWAGSEVPGNVLFPPLPAQITGIVAILTGLGGRANRGRKYIPFPATSHLDTNAKPTAAYVALIEGIGDAYVAGIDLNTGSGSTARLDPVLRHAGGTTTAVTSATPRTNWGTQRSRGSYGRPNALPVWQV